MPPPRRRSRGTGSVERDRARGGWRAVITINGERIRRRFDTAAEAETWLDDRVERRDGSGILPNEEVTVASYCTRFMQQRGARLSGATFRTYTSTIERWIKPSLGNIRLERLTRTDCARFASDLYTAQSARGTPLSVESRMSAWRILKAILNHAKESGVIRRSPLHRDDAPDRIVGERVVRGIDRAIPEADQEFLVAILLSPEYICSRTNHEHYRCGATWFLRLITGIRSGEARAIALGDLTLDRDDDEAITGGSLHLHQHAVRVPYVHGCGGAGCGKQAQYCTERQGGGVKVVPGLKADRTGERTLYIDAELGKVLAAHMEALAKSGRTRAGALMFSMLDGTPLSAEYDRTLWRRVLTAAGLEDRPYRVHDLRHTALTSIASSVSLYQATAIAGHSSSTVTERYVRPRAAATEAGITASSTTIFRYRALAEDRLRDIEEAGLPDEEREAARTLREEVAAVTGAAVRGMQEARSRWSAARVEFLHGERTTTSAEAVTNALHEWREAVTLARAVGVDVSAEAEDLAWEESAWAPTPAPVPDDAPW